MHHTLERAGAFRPGHLLFTLCSLRVHLVQAGAKDTIPEDHHSKLDRVSTALRDYNSDEVQRWGTDLHARQGPLRGHQGVLI